MFIIILRMSDWTFLCFSINLQLVHNLFVARFWR